MSNTTPRHKVNRLLAALGRSDHELLAPHLVETRLQGEAVLFEAGAPITHVYFPHSGVVSLLVVTSDGASVETATIGNEGVVGLGGLLAGDVSFTRQLVLLPGRAAVIDRRHFLAAVDGSSSLRSLLSVHSDHFVAQVLQSAACHALHKVEERLARWLLHMDDRWEGSEIPITHEALSAMLAVRRSTVTQVANELQSAGLIGARRGHIAITDRARLERTACECYDQIRRLHETHFVSGDGPA